MPWIERPERGWIAGIVTAPTRERADGAPVKVKRAGFGLLRRAQSVQADGNGFFGLTDVKPGRYRVWLDRDRGGKKIEVVVEAGKVARADLTSG